jgi:alpha-L-fucosidase 2
MDPATASRPPRSPTVTAGGLSFTWPSAAAGEADNVVASGQEISVTGSGSELGFLDTATYGPSSGTGTILYANGTTQGFTLNTADWYEGPSAGSTAAITMAYRNAPGNGQDDHSVYVYEQTIALNSASPAVAVVLPDVSEGVTAGSPALHVFAVALGG